MDNTLLQDNSFAQKIKYLRKKYELSMSELAYILKFKNKTSIGNIEKNIIYPSFEKLIDIANLFTVSIDWLVGFTKEPYNEVIIEQVEEKIAVISITGRCFIDTVPEHYVNKDLRKKTFTLSERAAIIFYIYYIQFLTGQKLELLYKEPTEIAKFDKKMNLILQKLYKLVLKL